MLVLLYEVMPAKEKRGRLLHFLFAFSVHAKLF